MTSKTQVTLMNAIRSAIAALSEIGRNDEDVAGIVNDMTDAVNIAQQEQEQSERWFLVTLTTQTHRKVIASGVDAESAGQNVKLGMFIDTGIEYSTAPTTDRWGSEELSAFDIDTFRKNRAKIK